MFPWRVVALGALLVILLEAVPTYLLEGVESEAWLAVPFLVVAGALAYRATGGSGQRGAGWAEAATAGAMIMGLHSLALTLVPWALGALEAVVADHGAGKIAGAVLALQPLGAAAALVGAAGHRVLLGPPPPPEEPLGSLTCHEDSVEAYARLTVFGQVVDQPGRLRLTPGEVRVLAYGDIPRLYLGAFAGVLGVLLALGTLDPNPLMGLAIAAVTWFMYRGRRFRFPLDGTFRLRAGEHFVGVGEKVSILHLECQGCALTIPLARTLTPAEREYLDHVAVAWRRAE